MPELQNQLQVALADRYRIEGEIRAGGMATVYLAQDLRRDRKVALQPPPPELSAVAFLRMAARPIRKESHGWLSFPHSGDDVVVLCGRGLTQAWATLK